jgi:hypothetical protein
MPRRSTRVPEDMWYRIDVCVRTHIDDEALHEIQVRANTYAIVDGMGINRDTEVGDCRFSGRIDAPNPVAALGALLTLIEQVSGPIGLVEEGSLVRVVVERDG